MHRIAAVPQLDVPVTVGRDEAREAARRELSDPRYHQDQPNPIERAAEWLSERLADLLEAAARAAPGGYVGIFVLVVLLIIGVAILMLRLGPMNPARRRPPVLFGERVRSAAEHRALAGRLAADGRHAEAVREWLRAVIRDLEERDVIDPRPGRTADEAAADAGRSLPERAGELRDAARMFDDVWYGGRPATPAMVEWMRELDARLRATRPTLAGSQR